jgi:hypothetical protein
LIPLLHVTLFLKCRRRAEAAFDDTLPDMLEQLTNDYPWLKRIAAKAHQKVWKFFTDLSI